MNGCSQTRCAARDHDRQKRAAEAAREVEGPALERELDAEDGALGEQQEAISGLDGCAGASVQGAGGGDGALGADQEVPPARELAAELREGGELVARDGGERERELEEREAVGEALVQRGDDVALVRVDVFEPADGDAQTDQAGGEPGPPALGGPARRPAADARGAPLRQQRGEAKDELRGAEEDEDGRPGPEPFAGGADGEIAAEEGAWRLRGFGRSSCGRSGSGRRGSGRRGARLVRPHRRRRVRPGPHPQGRCAGRPRRGRRPGWRSCR